MCVYTFAIRNAKPYLFGGPLQRGSKQREKNKRARKENGIYMVVGCICNLDHKFKILFRVLCVFPVAAAAAAANAASAIVPMRPSPSLIRC